MAATVASLRSLETLSDMAARRQLRPLGHLAITSPGAGLPCGTRSLVLLGPSEPGFWPFLQKEKEFRDGRPDPLDRWSRRAISEIASDLGATPVFPFDGPPYLPFHDWALRTGRFWQSPINLLVHDEAGLLVSIRGALALPWSLQPDAAMPAPCKHCREAPCLTSCPVDAFGPSGYAAEDCRGYLDTSDGADCLMAGCLARRACPISRAYPRRPSQSAFHMAAFHGNR
ncbi:hypothetical protein CLV78_11017 [Aliiruegeria haliotis]|uniref:4Fe-4S ferredoxin-type domain-containing protein n=1 Tax=Aliiruegeria haliotis TaxID=1280846 RepID=A0A2T0RIW0_9RHOB|nr:ferredoxin [Aliiruegeria haliotis]PRY21144.1 hypothetical protein CLV78_11017 [Aliiruegeria haliotis]